MEALPLHPINSDGVLIRAEDGAEVRDIPGSNGAGTAAESDAIQVGTSFQTDEVTSNLTLRARRPRGRVARALPPANGPPPHPLRAAPRATIGRAPGRGRKRSREAYLAKHGERVSKTLFDTI